MAGTGPSSGTGRGDRPFAPGETRPTTTGRRLERPPSERYGSGDATTPGVRGGAPGTGGGRSALAGPLIRALAVAAIGATALFVVGAMLASTAGLLFTAGVTGTGVGLVLARAAVPRGAARPVARRSVAWLAVALAVAAVAAAAIATWIVARGEGGTLGVVDYLLETFGPFIPGEAVVAALAAAWGANAGPVQA